MVGIPSAFGQSPWPPASDSSALQPWVWSGCRRTKVPAMAPDQQECQRTRIAHPRPCDSPEAVATESVEGPASGGTLHFHGTGLPRKTERLIGRIGVDAPVLAFAGQPPGRSEEHTSELQSLRHLVC